MAALMELFKDEDSSIRFSAAKAIGKQSTLSDTTMAALVELFKNEDRDVRKSAAKAIGKQSTLSDTTMVALVGLFKDEDWEVRESAAIAISMQSTLSDTIMAALIGLFKDEDSYVRSYAAQALGKQSTLSDTIMAALVLFKDENSYEAEELTKASQPQTLQAYLEACHSLSLAIQIVTDRSLTTQGDTTNPTGRIFPQRIIPWDDFPTAQEGIWAQLPPGGSFSSQPLFPSQHQLDYVMSLIRPISSEIGLRNFERDTVENTVQKLIDEAYNNPQLRNDLGLQGTVTFESHTNLVETDDSLSEHLDRMSIERNDIGQPPPASRPPSRKPRRKTRGKGNRADQFCIYRTSNGRNIPAVAIEYKAPHKLGRDEVITGLASEIQPERDVINKDGSGFASASRALTSAVVTQLFSYMIGKGIRYGYVCTGEVLVFLYIPDDPSTVYYHVCVPNLDVLDDDENRLHRTAVAQVFAFIMQALRAEPPPPSWHDAAAALDTWAVEYDDVLRNIPESVRKEARSSPYKPQRWKGFKRSPIQTRSRCKQPDTDASGRDTSDDDEEDTQPSPTPHRSSNKAAITLSTGGRSVRERGQLQDWQGGRTKQYRIQDRPFCTSECLRGLAYGGAIDKTCPNVKDHRHRHMERGQFLRLIRTQLAEDRGRDADATPLYLAGRIGALFKVRLSSYGYTLVAKGVETVDLGRLQHEDNIYNQLQPIQGTQVPVCLGRVDLVLPYYYDSGVFEHFLFLSWAGLPLFETIQQTTKADIINKVATAYKAIHRLHILHRDAEPRNIVYEEASGKVMIVDFERAEFRGRQPLGSLSPNAWNQRKRGGTKKQGKDDFAREQESAIQSVLRLKEPR
ncbi:hypothetical protein CkaCkLH20_09778 [Colletotrichum karsti]|uniref:Protein kinase domain-containing protein n=1 Tax=Colletotrichum karsti TaxID=1095194 RepID=A0A9P6HXX6_9PEZI|nr:uncharacterized protein CkaCkLH20_09778 [Colletotrichum karsti]KAF9872599.1 hypothetical protein CkaCkLH20_09778 [Colletotrichum karsti]